MRSFATSLISLSLPLLAFATHGVNHAHRHADVALRPRQQFANERLTWYDITVGLTACGGSYGANDYVVAINRFQWGSTAGSSPLCGKQITITYQGRSANAIIEDECMGCPYGGLDLTEGLFSYLAGQAGTGAGVLTGDWSFGGGAPAEAPTTSSEPPPPQPTTHYIPPTTTPQTTSSPPPPPSSSSTSTSTTSKTPSSVSSATPTTSHPPSSSKPSPTQTSLAQPSGSTVPNAQDEAIGSLYQAINGLAAVVLASNP